MSPAVTLKSLISVSKDGEWGKGEPFDDSVEMRVIRGTDFEDVRVGSIADLPIRHIPRHIAERKLLQPNDIIIETAGGSKDRPTGRTILLKPSLIHKSDLPLTCASFSRFIRLDTTQADPAYVFWLMQYLYDVDIIRKYHTQHTGVARFQWTTFSERESFCLPDFPIQHRIASILSAYDDLIENNTQRIKALEAAAQALYREWFVEFRFPGWQQVERVEIGEGHVIPEGWQWGCVGDIAKAKGGKRLPAGQVVQDEPTPYPYIRVRDFNPNGLDISDIKYITPEAHSATKRYIISSDEVYISIAGTIGRVGIIPDYLSGSNLTENAAKLCEIDENIGKYYLLHYLRSEQGQNRIQGMTGGASQPKLALYRIEEIPILLPPREIAQTFNTLADNAFRLQCKLQQRNAILRETRDLLLPRLISGEVSVEELPLPEED